MPNRSFRQRPARVVVIDDTPVLRRLLSDLLVGRGYRVVAEAASAIQGVRHIDQLRPDAALIDVHLPDQTGFELTRNLMCSHPQLAVLLTSADHSPSFPGLARASGARGFVPKANLGRTDLAGVWFPPHVATSRPADPTACGFVEFLQTPQQAFAQALRDELGSRARAGSDHAVTRVGTNGVVGDVELGGDLPSGHPERD
jgi:CheY-like chemotaxis protein